MKWMVLVTLGATLVVSGQELTHHSNAHQRNTAAKSKDSPDTAGRTAIVVNQQAPQGQKDDHAGQSPHSFRELLFPQNIPNVLLVLVGIAGIVIAVCSLRTISRQVEETGKQGQLMAGQLRAMHEQITEMSAQTYVLEKSVAVADKNATAAEQNVAIVISKERARIEIIQPHPLAEFAPNKLVSVTFGLELKGMTPPSIMQSGAVACITDSRVPPVESAFYIPPIQQLGELSLDNRIVWTSIWTLTSITLSQPEIDDLINGKKFIHFWGSIEYRDVFYDVFKRDRITAFRYVFGYSP